MKPKVFTPAIKQKFHRECPEGWNYRQLRSLVRLLRRHAVGPKKFYTNDQYAGLEINGMFIGIEKNGYAHT